MVDVATEVYSYEYIICVVNTEMCRHTSTSREVIITMIGDQGLLNHSVVIHIEPFVQISDVLVPSGNTVCQHI